MSPGEHRPRLLLQKIPYDVKNDTRLGAHVRIAVNGWEGERSHTARCSHVMAANFALHIQRGQFQSFPICRCHKCCVTRHHATCCSDGAAESAAAPGSCAGSWGSRACELGASCCQPAGGAAALASSIHSVQARAATCHIYLPPQNVMLRRDSSAGDNCRLPAAGPQQADQAGRTGALLALAGGLAAHGLLQPQAEARVAEPAPAGAEPIAKVVLRCNVKTN